MSVVRHPPDPDVVIPRSFPTGVLALLALVIAGSIASGALAADPIGRVVTIRGDATVQQPGERARDAAAELPVYVNDRVSTASGAAIRIRFSDGTNAYLGGNSEMTLDSYRQDREEPSFAASILKGVFRFATGLIARAKPQAVRVTIPTATIGIRGTHFAGEIIGVAAVVVLLDPEEADRANAIEVSNKFGAVVIEEPGYGTEIPDEFSPPSPPKRMRLRAVDNLMRSLQSIQRLPRGF